MSHDTDSFIDEVTDEVRRDRLYLLMRRYSWIGALVIVVIVGGAAWREYANAHGQAEAESWGDAVLAAQKSDDPVAALAALQPVGNPDRGALGELLTAGAALDAQDSDTAGTHLESAVTAAQDPALRDLARLKVVLAMGETMDPAARDAALAELSKPGAPFRLLALEQKAVALIAAGRDQDALNLIREIMAEDGVSQALNTRLTEMMITLGAEPGAPTAATPAAANAAAAPGAEPAPAPAE